ncbi:hypothetical protein B0H14DRAFT_2651871 [Mycena olivaceomarginata]|nr:hypothetical protein B0H14DRAFT_2651871 [Mycena olivaceomarginata]
MSICRTPVRFGVEPFFLDYKVLVAILRTRLDIFPLQIQIELIASVKARAIPAASDMFGLVLLILSHPNGTQGGSYRLDSGGTASAGRSYKTSAAYAEHPFDSGSSRPF